MATNSEQLNRKYYIYGDKVEWSTSIKPGWIQRGRSYGNINWWKMQVQILLSSQGTKEEQFDSEAFGVQLKA